mmetsp:Transcript_29558/g.26971  ORF Transcript_29558/g.26971 Transcript_29558/m.26971 type:complete len:157 (-) Transcript_29558:309-779(-)
MGEFPNSNQAELEGRIAILIRDLEDWKARYSKLEKANPQVAELQNQIERLRNECILRDQENEKLRQRLNDALNKRLEDEGAIRALAKENEGLKKGGGGLPSQRGGQTPSGGQQGGPGRSFSQGGYQGPGDEVDKRSGYGGGQQQQPGDRSPGGRTY